jgi:hypothetical protein
MLNRCQYNAATTAAQTKKIIPAKPVADRRRSIHPPGVVAAEKARLPRRPRPLTRKLFARVLAPPEVDFLMVVLSAGKVRASDCPKLAASLVRLGWLERDSRNVRLSEETRLLLAENGVQHP